MRETLGEERPPGVPETAKQGGDIRARWAWVEPEVWTERMLEALERGVKGGKWFSLIDKVGARRTLGAAWEQVRRNRGAAGVDRESIERFDVRAERNLNDPRARSRVGDTGPHRCDGALYRSPARHRSEHWGYRRSGIESYKPRCASC